MARKIEIQIVGDASSLTKALGQASKQAETSFGKVAKAAKYAGLALAGGLAVAAKIGFDELEQGQKVAAQTNAVLKSTGDVSNVSAGHVADLANALLMKSGIDDEVVASGENMLLTFKNIRNEAGAGNDIFDQSTKVLADMSVALGTDMPTSAIKLGKALNDPVKGVTALSRVGVTFTDGQKKQIDAMVKSGNVMGAQKLILKELNSEFGGSAAALGKTLPGQINIAKESFSNLAAQLVGALLPAFVSITGEALKIVRWLQEHTTAAKVLVGGMAGLAAALLIVGVAQKIYAASTAAATAFMWLFTDSTEAANVALLANPVGLVVVGLVALAAALVIAYKRSSTFRAIVQGAFHGVQVVAGAVISFVSAHWRALFPVLAGIVGIIKLVIKHWDTIKGAVAAVVGNVRDRISNMKDAIQSIIGVVRTVAGKIHDAFQPFLTVLSEIIGKVQWLLDHIPDLPSNPFSGGPGGSAGRTARTGRGGPQPSVSAGSFGANVSVGGGGGRRRPMQVNLVLDRRIVASVLVDADADYARHNGGRGLFA